MPELVRRRRGRGDFRPLAAFRARIHRDEIRSILHTGDWTLDPYVNRTEAVRRFRTLEEQEPYGVPRDHDWIWAERVATLEAWQRALFGYITPPEDVPDDRA